MNTYRLIIFDVDGTLYDLDDVVRNNYEMQVTFYAAETGQEDATVRAIFDKNDILPYKSEKARSATEFFSRNGISTELWRAYRELHTSVRSIDRTKAISDRLVERFAQMADLVLLSSNTEGNVLSVLEWLGLDKTRFAGVYSSTSRVARLPFSKETAVPKILGDFGVEPGKVLSIGDRYATDIRPLVELGGDGVLIRMPEELKAVCSDLSAGRLGENDSAPYIFYRGQNRTEGE